MYRIYTSTPSFWKRISFGFKKRHFFFGICVVLPERTRVMWHHLYVNKIFTKQKLILGVIGTEAGCSLHELTICRRGMHRERNKLSFWKLLMRWLQGWPYIPCWQFIGGWSWATLGSSTPEQVRLRPYETALPNLLCTYSCLVLHAVGLTNRGFGFCLCCMHAFTMFCFFTLLS